ncbi:unnamed protein product [Linum trigynum]|uniref:Uncharacterized protein n=1 Tax=Linum trigynum TaxID=586398 RepID=A0AAV2DLC1_9ROSI
MRNQRTWSSWSARRTSGRGNSTSHSRCSTSAPGYLPKPATRSSGSGTTSAAPSASGSRSRRPAAAANWNTTIIGSRSNISDMTVTLADKSAMEFRTRVPFYTASQLAAVQILMENVAGEKRIHVIELRICSGLPMIALMQAVASSPNSIGMLRITAS